LNRPKVTISEVAKRAGVSIGTASHVLSGRVNVKEDTKLRVSEAVEALGYIPNMNARVLRQAHSKIVGLCMPHRSSAFVNGLAARLEQIATEAGYSIMHVFSRQDPETELRRIKELLRVQIDGLILHPSITPQGTLDFLSTIGKPVLLIDSSNEDTRFDRVVLDNDATMERAGSKLYAMGHRRLLYIVQRPEVAVVRARLNGLSRARDTHPDLSFDTIVYRGDEAYLASELVRVLSGTDRPTTIITGNSEQAALVIAALRQTDVRYPDDVSLMTFDEPEWSTIVEPPLSVIRQPTNEIAELAWQMLRERMADPEAEPRKVMLTATIEMRGSVQPATLTEAAR
jgi:LacI family transcriptional regulator